MPDAAGGTSLSSDINPFENMQYRALENNLDEHDKHVLAVISALSAPANVDLKPGQISPNPSVGAAAIGARQLNNIAQLLPLLSLQVLLPLPESSSSIM